MNEANKVKYNESKHNHIENRQNDNHLNVTRKQQETFKNVFKNKKFVKANTNGKITLDKNKQQQKCYSKY